MSLTIPTVPEGHRIASANERLPKTFYYVLRATSELDWSHWSQHAPSSALSESVGVWATNVGFRYGITLVVALPDDNTPPPSDPDIPDDAQTDSSTLPTSQFA